MTIVRRRARTRLEQIDRELPELVDLLVVTVESGLGFSSSMQLAAERLKGPLGDELRLAMQEQAMGLPTDQVAREHPHPIGHARACARSCARSGRASRSASRSARSCATSPWRCASVAAGAAEERAQKAPIKILFPLVLLIFPAIFVVLLAPAMFKLVDAIGGGS